MRAVFYALGCAILVIGTMGLALLARLAPTWWIFASVGSGAALLMVGGWVGLRVAAGDDWPRPRTRHMLIVTGVIGALISLREMLWLPALWSAMVGLIGLSFSVTRGAAPAAEDPAESKREDG